MLVAAKPDRKPQGDIGVPRVDADGDGRGQERRAVALSTAWIDAQLFGRFPFGRGGGMLVDLDVTAGVKARARR